MLRFVYERVIHVALLLLSWLHILHYCVDYTEYKLQIYLKLTQYLQQFYNTCRAVH